MKPIVITVLAALCLTGGAGARSLKTADAALAGRIAGKPQSCIATFDRDRASRIADDGTILFGGRAARVYANRPANCPELRSNRGIATSTIGSQLCRGDIVQVLDVPAAVQVGSCTLGDFVPYDRAR